MTPKSSKAKGRRFQNWIRDQLVERFRFVEADDIKCAIMGEGGADIKLSPLAKAYIPLKIEAKNTEKLNIWSAYKQACEHEGEEEPVVFFKKNRQEPLVTIRAEYFLNLIGHYYG
ncbi:MAG TPA: hypothetical protein DHN29_16010 [Cytophagales bacterium]|nr:hypothetical protein [Cytophagales bacterium]|tara:strand:+ start:1321 stop:1665 length:345 start_codon:yes stop_codon:yes gene_type:complete